MRAQGSFNDTLFLSIALQYALPDAEWELFETYEIPLSDGEEFTEEHFFEVMEERPYAAYRFNISTNSQTPVAITFQLKHLPGIVRYEVIFAAAILVGVYVLIVFELVHRTIAALFGSFVALAILSKLHSRPTLEEVVSWIDFDTCGLLFGRRQFTSSLSHIREKE